MVKRIGEIDFLKAVMIVLMVVFHLACFSDLHPYAKQVVYTFHMPAFLVISGYLLSMNKGWKDFGLSRWWIFLPYLVMEACYATATTIMPVRDGLDELSLKALLDAVLLHPVGPYWYLHTLVLCDLLCYTLQKSTRNHLTTIILAAIVFWLLDHYVDMVVFGNAVYFLIGFTLRQKQVDFNSFVCPSPWAIIPLILLCCFPANLHSFSLSGIAITYLVCSCLLFVFKLLPEKAKRPFLFVGSHTLPILLFSPLFTMAAKVLIPVFTFDPTGLLFMLTATTLTLAGSLSIAKIMDITGISPHFCGKRFFE